VDKRYSLDSKAAMVQIKHEEEALRRFVEVTKSFGFEPITGQGKLNRINVAGNVYYQHGDLRVELQRCTVVVEVESSGGVTNLAKYWECYQSKRITKPIKLLHIFRQKSANDYSSHIAVWRFLRDKMQLELGDLFEASDFTYRAESNEGLENAVRAFGDLLEPHAV
jgi:hypothetical protein